MSAEPVSPDPTSMDPVETNPRHYRVVFENERTRVLEYTDRPGDRTTPHEHPDSVMYTLSSFRRRLISGENEREVEMAAGLTGWLPAQQHAGENIGDTETHVLFVEFKDGGPDGAAAGALGPQ
jgi:beta-alanine degradation protein BauB